MMKRWKPGDTRFWAEKHTRWCLYLPNGIPTHWQEDLTLLELPDTIEILSSAEPAAPLPPAAHLRLLPALQSPEAFWLVPDQFVLFGSYWQNPTGSLFVLEAGSPDFQKFQSLFLAEWQHPAAVSFQQQQEILDPKRILLQEIEQTEAEVAALQLETETLEQYYRWVESEIRVACYDLLLQIAALERDIAEWYASVTKKLENQQIWEEKQKIFEQLSEEEPETLPAPEEAHNQQDLKAWYLRGVKIAHPDLYMHDPALQEQANEMFIRLKKAYEEQDLETLQSLVIQAESGNFGIAGIAVMNSTEEMLERLSILKTQKEKLLSLLQSLKKNQYYDVFTGHRSVESAIAQIQESLKRHIKEKTIEKQELYA